MGPAGRMQACAFFPHSRHCGPLGRCTSIGQACAAQRFDGHIARARQRPLFGAGRRRPSDRQRGLSGRNPAAGRSRPRRVSRRPGFGRRSRHRGFDEFPRARIAIDIPTEFSSDTDITLKASQILFRSVTWQGFGIDRLARQRPGRRAVRRAREYLEFAFGFSGFAARHRRFRLARHRPGDCRGSKTDSAREGAVSWLTRRSKGLVSGGASHRPGQPVKLSVKPHESRVEEMSYTTSFLLIAGLYLLAAASPGPNFFIISQLALNGRQSQARRVAIGIAVGSTVWATAAVAGLSALLGSFEYLAAGLRVAGALYLVWYGVRLLRGALAPVPAADSSGSERNYPIELQNRRVHELDESEVSRVLVQRLCVYSAKSGAALVSGVGLLPYRRFVCLMASGAGRGVRSPEAPGSLPLGSSPDRGALRRRIGCARFAPGGGFVRPDMLVARGATDESTMFTYQGRGRY